LGEVDLAGDRLVRPLGLVTGLSIPRDFGVIDPVGGLELLDRRDAVPPGLRGDRMGRPLADFGDQVGRWVALERGQLGGMAGHEFLAGELGSPELRCVVLVPPDAGLLLLLELLASSVQVGQAAIEPFQVARCGTALRDRGGGVLA
jgi:hypothetical protein